MKNREDSIVRSIEGGKEWRGMKGGEISKDVTLEEISKRSWNGKDEKSGRNT